MRKIAGARRHHRAEESITAQVPAQLTDHTEYKKLIFNPPKKHAEQHPCDIEGCVISQEEHHRLMFGVMAENKDLKRRLKEAGLL